MVRPQSEKTRSVVTTLQQGLARTGSNSKSLGYKALKEDTETREYPQTGGGTTSKIDFT